MKGFTYREYETPKIADCISMPLAANWTERHNKGGEACVRSKTIP